MKYLRINYLQNIFVSNIIQIHDSNNYVETSFITYMICGTCDFSF